MSDTANLRTSIMQELAACVETAQASKERTDSVKLTELLSMIGMILDTKVTLAQMKEVLTDSYTSCQPFDPENGARQVRRLVGMFEALDQEPDKDAQELIDAWHLAAPKKGTRGTRGPNTGVTEHDVHFPVVARFNGKDVMAQGQDAGGFVWNSLRHYAQDAFGVRFKGSQHNIAWKAAGTAFKHQGAENFEYGDWTWSRVQPGYVLKSYQPEQQEQEPAA